MGISADTNLLVRIVMEDNAEQAELARDAFKLADKLAVSITALCELAWVLERGYGLNRDDVAASIQAIINISNVGTDFSAVQAGLEVLTLGGDFADGVIAYQGRRTGGEVFVSFDRKAVRLLKSKGYLAKCLQA